MTKNAETLLIVKSGPKLNLAQQIPLPCGFSLRVLANGIPGGLEVMLALGWLSGNAQARAVRDRWHSLPRQAKRSSQVEDPCRAVGIDVGQYFGIVAATAFDLGMDLAPFISGVERMTTRLAACVNQVMGRDSGQSKQYRESATVSPGFARLLSAEGCCDAMAGFREKRTLSQQQFSKVLGCGLRSVKRWEGRQCNPQPHQRWILELLRQYASRKGVNALRRHFVRELPRYRKPGRPAKLRRR